LIDIETETLSKSVNQYENYFLFMFFEDYLRNHLQLNYLVCRCLLNVQQLILK